MHVKSGVFALYAQISHAPRSSCLCPVLLSLFCVQTYSASESAPIFFFALPKKKTVAGGQKKKGALYGFSKGSIQQIFQRTAGAYRASSKGLCAFPDAQPLTPVVCTAWRCHCRFHSVRRDDSAVQAGVSAPPPGSRPKTGTAKAPQAKNCQERNALGSKNPIFSLYA